MKSKKKLSREGRKFCTYFLVFFLILGAILILAHIKYNSTDREVIAQYTTQFVVDYKVYNNDSKFYTEQYLGKGGQYISSITDHIAFDVQYKLRITRKVEFEYKFITVGELIVEAPDNEGNKGVVWKKQVINDTTQLNNIGWGNYFMVNKNIDVKFKQYQKIVDEYRKTYELPVSAYIKLGVTVYVESLAKLKKDIIREKQVYITVPLLQPTFKISTEQPDVIPKDIFIEIPKNKKISNALAYTGGIIIILGLVFVAIYYRHVKKTRTTKDMYNNAIFKLFKKYEEVIVRVDSIPNFEQLDIIEIKVFDDLIDLEEELHMPILYYEKEQDIESWFVVINGNHLYRYVVNISSFKLK